MGIGLVDDAGAMSIIRKRLLGGWVALEGPLESLKWIEDNIYPPGTPDNDGYSMLILNTRKGKVLPVIFIEKNPALKKLMADIGETTDSLVSLELGPRTPKQEGIFAYATYRVGPSLVLEKYAENFVRAVQMILGGYGDEMENNTV